MKEVYKLTEEHRAQLGPWRDRWIKIAMSTETMTESDKEKCRTAVNGLYAAANLEPPKAIVFVPSPFVLTFAAGFAIEILARRQKEDQRVPPKPAKNLIVHNTIGAALSASSSQLQPAGKILLSQAAKPRREACGSWFVMDCDMNALADELGVGRAGIETARKIGPIRQGGNQWPGYDAYLSFFQDVVGLDLPEYKNYTHWRTLTELSGPRIVHRDFCMISDKPELLLVDAQNRPHNDTGPFCRWRDGTALYSVHGVRAPAWTIEYPEEVTVEAISAIDNTEVASVLAERFGWDRYLAGIKAQAIDHDERFGTLYRTPAGLVCQVTNRSPEPDGSFRQFVLPIAEGCAPLPDPVRSPGEPLGEHQALTARNAVGSTWGMTGDAYEAILAFDQES